MPQALTRIASVFLPAPYNRAQALTAARQYAQQQITTDRREELRAEPPRTEVRYASRLGGTGESLDVSINAAPFATQQLAEGAHPLLTQRQPLAGYGAYAATAQQADPDRPRPGQKLDVSI